MASVVKRVLLRAVARRLSQMVNRFLDTAVPRILWQGLYYLVPLNLAYRALRNVHSRLTWSPENKVVLIAGASSGIGESLAYEFAKRGALLMLADHPEEKLHVVASQCVRRGASAVEISVADIAKEEDCRRIIDTTIEKYSKLDVLVSSGSRGPAFLFTDAHNADILRSPWDAGFMANVWMTMFALPHLQKSHGRILVHVSLAALAPIPRSAVVAATDSALMHFFDTVRVEEAGRHISATIAFHGLVQSEHVDGKVVDTRGGLDKSGKTLMISSAACAETMVKALAWDRRYTVVPYWSSILFLYRLLAAEVLDNFLRLSLLLHS